MAKESECYGDAVVPPGKVAAFLRDLATRTDVALDESRFCEVELLMVPKYGSRGVHKARLRRQLPSATKLRAQKRRRNSSSSEHADRGGSRAEVGTPWSAGGGGGVLWTVERLGKAERGSAAVSTVRKCLQSTLEGDVLCLFRSVGYEAESAFLLTGYRVRLANDSIVTVYQSSQVRDPEDYSSGEAIEYAATAPAADSASGASGAQVRTTATSFMHSATDTSSGAMAGGARASTSRAAYLVHVHQLVANDSIVEASMRVRETMKSLGAHLTEITTDLLTEVGRVRVVSETLAMKRRSDQQAELLERSKVWRKNRGSGV